MWRGCGYDCIPKEPGEPVTAAESSGVPGCSTDPTVVGMVGGTRVVVVLDMVRPLVGARGTGPGVHTALFLHCGSLWPPFGLILAIWPHFWSI